MNNHLLLIAPNFYDYPEEIKEELTEIGYNVNLFNDLSGSFLYRLSFKYKITYLKLLIENNLSKKIFAVIKKLNIKKILIIKGCGISEKLVKNIKNKKIDVTIYQWDSLNNFDYKLLLNSEGQVYSFDPFDCMSQKNVDFLPLFFSKKSVYEEQIKDIDLLFVGAFHSDRYEKIKEIKDKLPKGGNYCIYIYMPYYSYLYQRYIKNRKIDKSLISFIPLKRDDFYSKLKHSKFVLDLASPNQTGLTMRFYESLAAHSLVLTTNSHVKDSSPELEQFSEYIDDVSNFDFKTLLGENSDNIQCAMNKVNVEFYSLENWLKKLGY